MAVASLLLSVLAVAAWAGLWAEAQFGMGKTLVTTVSGMAVVSAPIAGCVLAVLALLRIRAAQGALRGNGLAIAGLLAGGLLIVGIVIAGMQTPASK